MTPRIRRPLVAGVAAFVLAATPGMALAQTDEAPTDRERPAIDRETDARPDRDRDFEAVKERVLAAIGNRLDALARMSANVEENEHVSANHAAHLQNDYRAAERVLEDAEDAVEDAETFAELREVVPEAFEDTLVIALLKPKTGLVLGSHTMVAIYDRMSGFGEKLQSAIDRLTERGFEMGAAQAALDEMVALLDDAEDLAEPVAGSAIGLDQSDWPDPAKSTLEQGKNDLQGARELLREARGQAKATMQAIREALGR